MVKVGDIILVCDVGGGTTDFTLIAVSDEGGDLILSRLAVGEHILLGGDNMDLALAYAVAATLPQGMEGLDAAQRVALGHACRNAKEALFGDPRKDAAPVTVLGRGSKVIGGSVKTELTRAMLSSVLFDGFLPACAPTDLPARGRRVGLTEIGLPYAADAAITRHLARFLSQQAGSLHTGGTSVLPSAVLFNGGVFKAGELRQRVLDVLSSWAGRTVPELESTDLDLAVAHGATYYGQVRRGRGVRIRGGVPRSYYIGLETSAPAVPGVAPPIKALCVVPMGMEEGTETDVPGPELGLVVGDQTEFRFLGSTTRREDPVGTILDRWTRRRAPGADAPRDLARSPRRQGRRGRPGATARPGDRGRYARPLVPEHPRRSPVEARIQRPRDARRVSPMSTEVVLTIEGLVESPLRLSYLDLDALPEADRVPDVSRFHPARKGAGVTLDAILDRASIRPEANYATLHADRDDFHVSIPLGPLREQGIVVYRLNDGWLGPENGGPIRLLIRDPSACHTGELDECANVKYLCRIELTSRRGRDTRPTSEAEHAALHLAEPAG